MANEGREKALILELLAHRSADALTDDYAAEFEAFYDRPALDRALLGVIRAHKRRAALQAAGCTLRRAGKRAAVVLLAFLAVSGCLFVTVEAFRVRVINFFSRESELYTLYGAAFDDGDLRAAGFSYVPEGFALAGLSSDPGVCTLLYSNEVGEIFLFEQFSTGHSFGLDAEAEQMPVTINGKPGSLVSRGDSLTLLWEWGGFFYWLDGSGLEAGEAIKIAESLRAV